MFKRIAGVASVLIAVSLTAGCAIGFDRAELPKVNSAFIIEPMSVPDSSRFEEGYYEVIDENSVGFHLAGSGSCPPIIETAYFSDNKTVQLQLKDWGDRACTMDYRSYSQKVTNNSKGINMGDYKFEICTPIGECKLLTQKSSTSTKA